MYENLNRLKDNKVLYYIVVEISAETLSNQMLRKEKYNLNAISHDTAMDMIQNTLNKGIPL
jgi:ribonuclease H2 subunit A